MEFINQAILYFFHASPGRAFQYYVLVGVIIVILLALTGMIILYSKKNKKDKAFRKLFRNYPTKFIIIAALLGLYLLVRYNYIAFFSMRFLLYILLASAVYVVVSATYTYIKKYPAEKELREKRAEKNKYIPRKKKRNK